MDRSLLKHSGQLQVTYVDNVRGFPRPSARPHVHATKFSGAGTCDTVITLPAVVDVDVVPLSNADLTRVARLCSECTAFFELVESHPGGETTAAEILGPL